MVLPDAFLRAGAVRLHRGGFVVVRTYLTGADTAFQVEGAGDRMPRERLRRDVGQEGGGVDVDGVAAWGPQDGDAGVHQALPQEARGGDAVLQIALQCQPHCEALLTTKAPGGAGAAERARQAVPAGDFEPGCNS